MTTTEMTYSENRRRPSALKRLIEDHIGLAVMVWASAVVVLFAIVLVVSNWTEITSSVWQEAGTQAPRWYVLFIGVHIGYSVLPLHLTHGQTRREFASLALKFVLVFGAATAALVTVGFVLEAGFYELLGWDQRIQDRHLYNSPWDLHTIMVESVLAQTLWTAGGLFLGVAFYRSDLIGGAAIVFSIFIAGVAGIIFGGDWGPFGAVYDNLIGESSVRPVIGIPLYIACIATVLALTWPIMRDVAVRTKSA